MKEFNLKYYKSIRVCFICSNIIFIFLGIFVFIMGMYLDNEYNFSHKNNTMVLGECNLDNLVLDNCISNLCNIVPNFICEDLEFFPIAISMFGGVVLLFSLSGFCISYYQDCNTVLSCFLFSSVILVLNQIAYLIYILFYKYDIISYNMKLIVDNIGNFSITQAGELFDLFECCGLPNYNEGLNFSDYSVNNCKDFPTTYCQGCYNYNKGCEIPMTEFFGIGTGFFIFLLSLMIGFDVFIISGSYLYRKMSYKYKIYKELESSSDERKPIYVA